MKTATVRQLRTTFPRIESWITEGETVVITKHRKIVAELCPPRTTKNPDWVKRFGGKCPSVQPGKGAVDLLMEERGL